MISQAFELLYRQFIYKKAKKNIKISLNLTLKVNFKLFYLFNRELSKSVLLKSLIGVEEMRTRTVINLSFILGTE